LKSVITLCLIGLLAACSEKTANETPKDQKPQTNAATPKGANSDAVTAFNEGQKKAKATKPAPDLSVPLENYTALKQDKSGSWLTNLAVAYSDPKPDDKELLNLFSAKYYNEQDAFKKQDLIATELPPIKELLAAYSKQRYYSLEFGTSNDGIAPFFTLTNGYDFENKSFKVNNGEGCFSTRYANQQSVTLSFVEASPTLCNAKIDDIEMAKRVEQLRAANTASLRGKIYFFVQSVEQGNSVQVIPTHIQYDIYDKPFYLPGSKQVTSVLLKAPPAPQ
jgi:hypothetical protein